MINRRALLFQSIRGPVTLIVIGVLFLLQQEGIARIAQTWPLILIVVGVIRLMERLSIPAVPPLGPSNAYVPPAPPPGGFAR